MPKASKPKKQLQPPLAIKGTFTDLMQAIKKDAEIKKAPRKSA